MDQEYYYDVVLPGIENYQKKQQRFEAVLKFIEIKMSHGSGSQTVGDAIDESITLADLLMSELETTRTKTDEDTLF